jgi:HK97 family phage prohead protease
MDLQLKYAAATTKSVNAATRTLDAIVSDETVDRMGDIIDAATWKLANYQKDPVVLFQHRTDQPIGQTTRIWVQGTQLHATMVLSQTERATEVMQLFADGSLRAFSVGFRVGRIADQVVAGRNVTRLLDCELHEISAVSIPANANALIKMKSLGLVPPSYSALRRSGDEMLCEVRKSIGIVEGAPDESAYDHVMRKAKEQQREHDAEHWPHEYEKVGLR